MKIRIGFLRDPIPFFPDPDPLHLARSGSDTPYWFQISSFFLDPDLYEPGRISNRCGDIPVGEHNLDAVGVAVCKTKILMSDPTHLRLHVQC